jgi:DNA-3-methyladenine glycosylase I
MQPYHDSVWGRPETDESRLFRSQTLQLMQCGVSWTTVWRKRDHFERAFKSYDVDKVARFSDADISELMSWPDGTIIRNRAKLRAVVQNARIICAMRAEAASGIPARYFGQRISTNAAFVTGAGPSFAALLWSFCPANARERLKSIDSVSGRCCRRHS